MIEGLKVTVAGTELVAICRTRADDRRARAKRNRDTAAGMEGMDIPLGNSSQRDPKADLIATAERYEADAMELDFVAAHLDQTESYQLASSDLRRLGIVSSGW